MNLQHLKYMVEVERVGSITKAAANLFMGQPNLSKAIKDVENELGITVFKRSAKGVYPTEKGAEFLSCAKEIIQRMERIEALYKPDVNCVRFSASVPADPAVVSVIAEFAALTGKEGSARTDIRETCAAEAVENVSEGISGIGIIRFPAESEKYYLSLAAEKRLECMELCSFEGIIAVSEKNSLAKKPVLSAEELAGYTEICPFEGESFRPSEYAGGHISLNGAISCLELLSRLTEGFMIMPPVPDSTLKRFGLKGKKLSDPPVFKEMLIFPSSYKLSEYDRAFTELMQAMRKENT